MFSHINNYTGNNNYPYSQTYSINSPQSQINQQPTSNIIWVQGEAGAKSYLLVGSNQSILLMDSETNAFYIKSTDTSGIPQPLRYFDYSERKQKQENNQNNEYITRKEFEKRLSEIKNNAKQSVQST